ncbi:TPA: site-specific integrase [Legionella pneumophila]|nr:site-specific integrase [Legionella pneumophila]
MLNLATTEKSAISRDGYIFNPEERIWKISREHPINLSWVDELLEKEIADSFLHVLAHYAKKYSAAHTHNQAVRFQHFSKERRQHCHKHLSKISSEALISYRATLDQEHEWYLGALRGFLKTWIKLGYLGINDDVKGLLDHWRLKGNIKGRAVQTLCPTEGPLSDLEFEALHQKLTDAFESNAISTEDFILAQVFIATGRRPAQLADLKIKDLVEAKANGGLHEFILNVPRRKQRGIHWREQFKPFALSTDLGLLIKNLIEKNSSLFLKLFNISSLCNIEELPIFPRWNLIKATQKESKDVNTVLKKPEIHHLSSELRFRLDTIVSSLEIHSERTRKRLRVFPTRLRRTLATRAAREGFGELIIAELLDHSDTQNARVYTENVPEHVDAINKAVAKQLAPLAQAFAGMIVEKESDAKRGNDLTSRVRCESGNVGTCGHYGFCGALAPIACYTCRNFQPWADAPHEDVLNSLIAERNRILEITKDQSMASINDRTILAVTQVIQICEKRHTAICERQTYG